MNRQEGAEDMQVRRLEVAAEWLLKLNEEQLSDDELQAWLNWCEADADNLAAFERMQGLWRGVPNEVPQSLTKSRRAFGAARSSSAAGRRLALAASIAALAVVLGVAYQWLREAPSGTIATRIEAPLRANENSVLPDGSTLALSAGSKVSVDFTPRRRRLEMQEGIAFFKVKADTVRPFIVQAGPVKITALGTSFNVRRFAGRVVVTVNEGLVRIDRETGESVRAAAGQQLMYDAGSGDLHLASADAASELAWREGRLVYNGEPLETVIESVSRYSKKKIVLADETLKQLRFTGTVFVDSIDTWVGALPRAFPVSVEEQADNEILIRRRKD